MRAQSPITYASKIKAPTLIMSDTGDYRVTIMQSFKLYHAPKNDDVHRISDPGPRPERPRCANAMSKGGGSAGWTPISARPQARAAPRARFKETGSTVGWISDQFSGYEPLPEQ